LLIWSLAELVLTSHCLHLKWIHYTYKMSTHKFAQNDRIKILQILQNAVQTHVAS